MARIRYTAKCNCGWSTSVMIEEEDVIRRGRSFTAGSADTGKVCRCGNGGFLFRLNSKRGEQIIARQNQNR